MCYNFSLHQFGVRFLLSSVWLLRKLEGNYVKNERNLNYMFDVRFFLRVPTTYCLRSISSSYNLRRLRVFGSWVFTHLRP